MLKRLVIALSLMVLPTISQAQTSNSTSISNIISSLKWDVGVGYDVINHQTEETDTVELVNYKGVAINIGYGTVDSFLAGVSYDGLPNLSKFGVTLPILSQITFSPSVYWAWSRINGSDLASGKQGVVIGAKLINIKF